MDQATVKRQQKLDEITAWNTTKPTTDVQWAEDVKAESLHVKYDYQLAEMELSHQAKIPKVDKDLDKFTKYPDAIKYELEQQFTRVGGGIRQGDAGGAVRPPPPSQRLQRRPGAGERRTRAQGTETSARTGHLPAPRSQRYGWSKRPGEPRDEHTVRATR